MDILKLARYFTEGEDGEGRDFYDRLLLRIFEYPAFLNYMDSTAYNEDGIELVFNRIPDAQMDNLIQALGCDITCLEKVQFRTKTDRPMIAIKISPKAWERKD